MNRRIAVFSMLFAAIASGAAAERVSLDFDIARAQQALRAARSDVFRAAAHINLGDLYSTQSRAIEASTHYETASRLARSAATEARADGNLRRYSEAVSYAGLAAAKQRRAGEAWDAFDDALRYGADWPHLWSLKTSAMLALGMRDKAVASARNGLAVAGQIASREDGRAVRLDLLNARYSLASVLSGSDQPKETAEATTLLESVVSELRDRSLDSLRREAARREAFESLSSTSSDVGSYVSLLHRSRIRLVRLYGGSGRDDDARALYRELLAERSDDPDVLALGAIVASNSKTRVEALASALDANPFSFSLVREYEKALDDGGELPPASDAATVRSAVEAFDRAAYGRSLALVSRLAAREPANDTLLYLEARSLTALGRTAESDEARRRISSPQVRAALDATSFAEPIALAILSRGELIIDPNAAELGELIRAWPSLSPDQRMKLDAIELSALALFEPGNRENDTTTLAAGTVDGVRFRFPSPVTFRGEWDSAVPLRLRFRIASVAEEGSSAVLILDPIGVSN